MSHGASCCMCSTNETVVETKFSTKMQVEVEVDGVTAARAIGPAGVEDVAVPLDSVVL